MWLRFTWYDITVIAHYLGVLVSFFSVAMALPLLTAVVFGEWEPLSRYVLAIGVSLTVGSLLRMTRPRPGRLTHQQALAVTGLAWMVLAIVASIPLALSGHYGSYLDALFEGVSGLTTTGASLVVDLEHLSYADNMWRFTMHFIGGLGLIVIALSLGFMGKSTSGLYSSEGRSDHVLPNVVSTTRTISVIAVVIVALASVVLAVCCLASGMDPARSLLHGLWLAVSGFMTAGFTPTGQSLIYYHSYATEFVCMLLMLLGSISFALFVGVTRGRTKKFFEDIEIRTAVLWFAVTGFAFMAALTMAGVFDDLPDMLRRGVFLLISAATTTGFQNVTNNQLVTVIPSGALLILGMLMAIGGSSGSTSGGMKLLRLGLIAKSIIATVKETLSPASARVSVSFNHLGRQILTSDIVRSAMTVSALFALSYIVGALAGVANGYDATSAIFESISMASNGGLSSGIVSRGMPPMLEVIYIVEMWAGRLEFITLIALVVKIVVSCTPRMRPSWMESLPWNR